MYFKSGCCLRTFWNTTKNTQAMILKLKMQLTHEGWKHFVEWSRVWLFLFRLFSWNQKFPFFTNFGLSFKPECLKRQLPWKTVNLDSCQTVPIFSYIFTWFFKDLMFIISCSSPLNILCHYWGKKWGIDQYRLANQGQFILSQILKQSSTYPSEIKKMGQFFPFQLFTFVKLFS